jgi:hypothetical protein
MIDASSTNGRNGAGRMPGAFFARDVTEGATRLVEDFMAL